MSNVKFAIPAAMLKDMEHYVDNFFPHFKDDPAKLSGWGHNYFCEDDGGRLVFSPDSPHQHKCPVCGHIYTGDKYDTTWTYLYRCHTFMGMMISACLYKETGEDRFLTYVKDTLGFYADNYQRFTLHAKDIIEPDLNVDVGGAARILSQGLNESAMLVKVLNVLDMLRDDLDESFLLHVKIGLFVPAIDEILTPQLNTVHNIKCWVNSAIGMAGIFFDVHAWKEIAFQGEYNIHRQLRDGVTSDNFWYEGSIHYNFYTLEGIANLLRFCEKYSHPFGSERETVKEMLYAAYHYAFDNGVLPNPNDGWPDVNLKTYSFIYYTALAAFPEDKRLTGIIAEIQSMSTPRIPLPLWDPYCYEDIPLEKFIYASHNTSKCTAEKRSSRNFPHSNFAILRSCDINLFFKYGHNGPSHAHPDRMTFELTYGDQIVTRDLSNAGYGARICNEWHRMSAAHNTVVANGQNHTRTDAGEVLLFDSHQIKAHAEAYEGIAFTRHFQIEPDKLQDTFEVSGQVACAYDYFLHIDGDILPKYNSQLLPANLGFSENGYQHIKNAVCASGHEFIVNTGGICFELSVDGGEIFLCETLDNPVTRHRRTLIIRKTGKDVAFSALWKMLR